MNRTLILSFIGVFALACGTKDDPMTSGDSQAGSDEGDSGSTGEPMPDPSVGDTGNMSGTEGGSSSDGMSGESTGVAFLQMPDGGGVGVECDIWAQDCPKGDKCMPWANDGGSAWNATRCSEVADNPGQVGDECTVEGGAVSGIDDCEVHSMCYYVDSETNVGTCVGFCAGNPESPICEPDFLCSISNSGVLILCRRECDPILQDCMGSAACLGAAGSDGFVCIADASGEAGAPGDPCEFLNSCDPGLFCANAEVVPNCGAAGCCSEFCDLTEPEPDLSCSLPGQLCEPWFGEGSAPPDLIHVGACALPL
jgi:hypothetical protein